MPIDGIRPRFGAPWHFCRLRVLPRCGLQVDALRYRSAVETNSSRNRAAALPYAALLRTRAAGGVTAERREASAGLPSGGVETRAQLVARRCPPAAGRARAGVMASVEHYLTVLAGAQSAQNAEAQRAAAQMQIEVRLPRDRERQDAWSCARFVEARTRLATVPPPRRSAIPSFSHPLVPSGARIVVAFRRFSVFSAPRREARRRARPFSLLTRPSASARLSARLSPRRSSRAGVPATPSR